MFLGLYIKEENPLHGCKKEDENINKRIKTDVNVDDHVSFFSHFCCSSY